MYNPLRGVAFLAAVCFFPVSSQAGTPSEILGLSSWKITVPIDIDGKKDADEIAQPELGTFSHPEFFHVNEAGDGVVFRAPCGGVTTKGSKFPRSELREMTPDGARRAEWSTGDPGTHFMEATIAITHLPPVKPHVVCAQIHDASDDLIMVRLEGRKLMVERNDDPSVPLDDDYELGTPFQIRVEAGKGHVRLWYEGKLELDWEVARDGCYFKAGCYTQSNVSKGDAPDSFAEVEIHQLESGYLE